MLFVLEDLSYVCVLLQVFTVTVIGNFHPLVDWHFLGLLYLKKEEG